VGEGGLERELVRICGAGGMKERAEVVVIGAGIVGCSAAHYLTLAGVRNVVVVDQGPIGDTGGLVVPRAGPVLPDERLEALVHARAVVGRPLPRARHARSAAPGGRSAPLEVATTPERLARSSAAMRSPRRGASRAT
jgi:2-polyprenyl-6-methoxyphenol hydroxylase-like FAD-dependent oxidoreductase